MIIDDGFIFEFFSRINGQNMFLLSRDVSTVSIKCKYEFVYFSRPGRTLCVCEIFYVFAVIAPFTPYVIVSG